MMERVANWHGEQACVHYQNWLRTDSASDLRNFARHTAIADKMWARLRQPKFTYDSAKAW